MIRFASALALAAAVAGCGNPSTPSAAAESELRGDCGFLILCAMGYHPDARGCRCVPDRCRADADCSDGLYCKFDRNCGGRGLCAYRPEACYDSWEPVCGCDGVTYSNHCDAAAAGANLSHDGACAAPGACTSDADCSGRQLCCYPCGVEGCQNRCMDAAPGGGCPLFP